MTPQRFTENLILDANYAIHKLFRRKGDQRYHHRLIGKGCKSSDLMGPKTCMPR